MGEAVAGIHRVSHAGRPSRWIRGTTNRSVPTAGTELVGQLRDAGAPFADRLAELRDELVALESWVVPPAALQTCHRDLWADNLLPTADGGVCVIDWENSGPADPNHELGCVLFEFGRDEAGRARAIDRRLPGRRRTGGGDQRATSRC